VEVNKKGFTLIELLAVIVILAVIALIATPVILQIITKARKAAAENSVYGMMEATRYAYFTAIVEEKSLTMPITVTCTTTACIYTDSTDTTVGTAQTGSVDFSGTKMTEGEIKLNSEGKFEESEDGKKPKVNGFYCTISKATQRVSCE
jgi:prepilin-type N-terminal cleavage/methylation domain-containing protein